MPTVTPPISSDSAQSYPVVVLKIDTVTEFQSTIQIQFEISRQTLHTYPSPLLRTICIKVLNAAHLPFFYILRRRLHLENNPDYKQFIVGADIALLVIHIDKARMCDIQDRVSYWNARDGICSTEATN